MLNLSEIRITSLENSQYVQPYRMKYTQNGKHKIWDLVKCHPSVAIIIYNVSRKVLVCVKQFRPGVYLNSIPDEDKSETIDPVKYPASLGVTLEFCAGIMDKAKTPEEIAAEEVLEECGYKVEPSQLEEVKRFRCSVGISGDKQVLYYVQVDDSMKVNEGGGIGDEIIEVVELSLEEGRQILDKASVQVPGEFLFALLWFYTQKLPSISDQSS